MFPPEKATTIKFRASNGGPGIVTHVMITHMNSGRLRDVGSEEGGVCLYIAYIKCWGRGQCNKNLFFFFIEN